MTAGRKVTVEFGQVRVDLEDRTLAAELAAHLGLQQRPAATERQRIWHGTHGGVPITVTSLGTPGGTMTDEALARLLADIGVQA